MYISDKSPCCGSWISFYMYCCVGLKTYPLVCNASDLQRFTGIVEMTISIFHPKKQKMSADLPGRCNREVSCLCLHISSSNHIAFSNRHYTKER